MTMWEISAIALSIMLVIYSIILVKRHRAEQKEERTEADVYADLRDAVTEAALRANRDGNLQKLAQREAKELKKTEKDATNEQEAIISILATYKKDTTT